MAALPDPPVQLKAIQSYMKIASDIERVDPVVAYWVRLYSTETALSIDRDSPECKTFLSALILWLEHFKKEHKGNEAVTNQTVGQAHFENFVVALFDKADSLDRAGTANKNTVRMFFMGAILFEAMAVFGPLTDEINKRAKYAKFKAAYIQKCLKSGQTPKPGPIEGSDLEGDGAPSAGEPTNLNYPPVQPPKVPDEPPRRNSLPKPDPFILTPSSPPQARPPVPPTTPNQPPASSYLNEPGRPVPTTPSSANNSFNSSQTTGNRSTIMTTKFTATNGAPLNAEDIIKGQKYCKFATSALQYDDIPTAVSNLEKALKLLTTGQNPD